MVTPRYRQERIAEILAGGPVESQDELARRLRAERIRVSQATLSRDLREMGVVRGPRGYVLAGFAPATPASAKDQAERLIREFVRSVAPAGSLAVVKTDPGHAHTLGVAIDQERWEEIAGTIAGDDTVFIASRSARGAARIVERIRKILG